MWIGTQWRFAIDMFTPDAHAARYVIAANKKVVCVAVGHLQVRPPAEGCSIESITTRIARHAFGYRLLHAQVVPWFRLRITSHREKPSTPPSQVDEHLTWSTRTTHQPRSSGGIDLYGVSSSSGEPERGDNIARIIDLGSISGLHDRQHDVHCYCARSANVGAC